MPKITKFSLQCGLFFFSFLVCFSVHHLSALGCDCVAFILCLNGIQKQIPFPLTKKKENIVSMDCHHHQIIIITITCLLS